jgi:hypothetical protein
MKTARVSVAQYLFGDRRSATGLERRAVAVPPSSEDSAVCLSVPDEEACIEERREFFGHALCIPKGNGCNQIAPSTREEGPEFGVD